VQAVLVLVYPRVYRAYPEFLPKGHVAKLDRRALVRSLMWICWMMG
jgi:hypothetical protein